MLGKDRSSSGEGALHLGSLTNENENNLTEWTDDLPVCRLSGVGSATNQIYREDGIRREGHEFEDRSFRFSVDNNIFLYGVFDGHSSCKVSAYAAQNLPADILLDQLKGKTTDKEIKDVLYQAFLSVENGYSQLVDGVLAEKYDLQLHLPREGDSEREQERLEKLKRLKSMDAQLQGGTTALVALIVNNKLYIANIGCNRALLCTKDPEGLLHVNQLTNDHNLENQSELDRLASLGLDVEKIKQSGGLGGHSYTRSIGDHYLKNHYPNIELLQHAESCPLTAVPEISDCIQLTDSCCFLVLMSDGLHKALTDSGITEHANIAVTRMIAQQFAVQSTLNGVTQAVVDQAVRIHHDTFMTATDPARRQRCQRRDDITLIIRSFNYPLPKATLLGSPGSLTGGSFSMSMSPAPPQATMTPLSLVIPAPSENLPLALDSPPFSRAFFDVAKSSSRGQTEQSTLYSSTNESMRSHDSGLFKRNSAKANRLPLDEYGRIEAYIGFDEFFRAVEELTDAQRETLNAETEPKPDFETIPEEKEPSLASSKGSVSQ